MMIEVDRIGMDILLQMATAGIIISNRQNWGSSRTVLLRFEEAQGSLECNLFEMFTDNYEDNPVEFVAHFTSDLKIKTDYLVARRNTRKAPITPILFLVLSYDLANILPRGYFKKMCA